MDSQSNIENVPVPVPVSVPTPVTDVPELDDVSLEVPTEPVGSVEDPEADKENSPENEEDRDENVSKILNRNYYQIAHDLQQHDGGGDNDASASLLPEDEDPLDASSSAPKTTNHVNTEEEEHLDAIGGLLEVIVANPEKSQTPMESYITYEVKTETARLEYAASSLCIRRRFQDFIWLKEKLETHHPGCLIPPLPSKQHMKGILDKFSVEFVRKRCIQLNAFVRRVSAHQKLTRSKFLRKFLTLPSSDFTLVRKSDSSGFASRLTNMTKLIAPLTIKPKWTAESETQEKLQHRMESLERNTEALANISQKHIDYYDLLLPSIINWEKSETKEDLCNSLSKFRVATTGSKECAESLNSKLIEKIQPSFTEYGRYSDSVKRLLKRRDAAQAEVEDFQETIASKKADENATRLGKFTIAGMLSGNSESQRQERISKLQVEVKEFEVAEKCAAKNLDNLEEEAKDEILKYNQQRARNMADVFSKFAQYQASYYEDMAKTWRNGTSTDLGE
ncbi:unnamed protein product [Oikopleura dioica]|uniref:PX domain-containing protein n=1 Tax=Oikopleura dioica TaxID=34765 RepID=E4X574_OIKDI|nr:unnamed protein product [Oikopleura dioica]